MIYYRSDWVGWNSATSIVYKRSGKDRMNTIIIGTSSYDYYHYEKAIL